MGKFTGVVYDPPAAGLPHLAVYFSEDLSRTLAALPVKSLQEGEVALQELAQGFAELAAKGGKSSS